MRKKYFIKTRTGGMHLISLSTFYSGHFYSLEPRARFCSREMDPRLILLNCPNADFWARAVRWEAISHSYALVESPHLPSISSEDIFPELRFSLSVSLYLPAHYLPFLLFFLSRFILVYLSLHLPIPVSFLVRSSFSLVCLFLHHSFFLSLSLSLHLYLFLPFEACLSHS